MNDTDTIITRPTSAALDAILGKKITFLRDQCFVRPVDYMGNEAAIVQAARISYGKGTKSVSEDVGLIRYLMRHRHSTPVEMAVIKFHIRLPMDVMRQHIRHRMSSTNEYSTRYSEAIDEMLITDPVDWRLQSATNKQGSSGGFVDPITGAELSAAELDFQLRAVKLYQHRLAAGVSREQARKDLPLSTMTEAYWKIDLHNLLHYISLRSDSHAQEEIRRMSGVFESILRVWVPNVMKAFAEYRKAAITLHANERVIVRFLQEGKPNTAMDVAYAAGWLERNESTGLLKANRERSEFEEKLLDLGMSAPWIPQVAS